METLRVVQRRNSKLQKKLSKQDSKFEEEDLLLIMKKCLDEYLSQNRKNHQLNPNVITHLEKVRNDDAVLIKYLKGRKNDPFIAWDSLKRYTENKYQIYPEIFPKDDNDIPPIMRELAASYVCGILKGRDKFGRRIAFFDTTKWDPNVYSILDMNVCGVYVAERFWTDPEVFNKGLVVVQNTQGFGMAHARLHSMQSMQRARSVFLYSFPVSIKGIFYLHMPFMFTLFFKIAKPLFPKKMRRRMHFYSGSETPTSLLEIAPPEMLPTWMGGKLTIEEAAEDISFYERKLEEKNIQFH